VVNIIVDALDIVITGLYVTNTIGIFVSGKRFEDVRSWIVKIRSRTKTVGFE
jgi:hypothetical protein